MELKAREKHSMRASHSSNEHLMLPYITFHNKF
ncbi:LANO_0G18470g1_1 [Lachancea nothofagi CBS 11611]|uniref:LANO_0G18470g1_1 n=1 Tax=Lachancea nothofagi CBS 11611 TaxID=1266666 RepID=A0A1G4KKW4_9SACH|nr:LANO_0G18470g1_1 [Lachancea nothofagi CBS 11611]